MKIKERLQVETYGFGQIASYYVNCFDRMLYIIFNPIPPMQMFDAKDFEDELDKLYEEWHNNDTDMCCEEFMLENLPQEMYNSIIAVMYDINEEEI